MKTYKTREEAVAAAPCVTVCGLRLHPIVVATSISCELYVNAGIYDLKSGPIGIKIEPTEWGSDQFMAQVWCYGIQRSNYDKCMTVEDAARWCESVLSGMLRDVEQTLSCIREWRTSPREGEKVSDGC